MAAERYIAFINYIEFRTDFFFIRDTHRIGTFDAAFDNIGNLQFDFFRHFKILNVTDSRFRSEYGYFIQFVAVYLHIGYLYDSFGSYSLTFQVGSESYSVSDMFKS